jgi:hypothetical protein
MFIREIDFLFDSKVLDADRLDFFSGIVEATTFLRKPAKSK